MKHNNHIIFKNCLITDPLSKFNESVCDIELQDGIIQAVSKESIQAEGAEIIDIQRNRISPGIFDLKVNCGEPGFEEKETFTSLNSAGIRAGVTGMLVMPASKPATDNRGQVEYRAKLSKELPVDFQFAGTISNEGKGKQLSEMYDMSLGGAIAFTDDTSALNSDLLMHLSMQYQHLSGGLLMFQADDAALRLGGSMHEGKVSVRLGIKGSPAISEEVGLARLLALARYNDARIHINGISSARSIQQIQNARNEGINVSCSVYVHHLYFCDEDLYDYSSNFKVWPPLRGKEDREALKNAVKSGVIDVICSDHRPENIELKDVEFDYASFGMSGIDTLLNAALTSVSGNEHLGTVIQCLCHAPRKLLGLPSCSIEIANTASFMVYDANEEGIIDSKNLKSLSANNAFIGKSLKGKMIGTYTAGKWFAV
jgi:dihydroorotase